MKLAVSSHVARALLISAGALAVRLVYFLLISRTACLDINLDSISDMETFHRWAMSIVEGDWVGRSNFHPFHPWQIAVADPEQWTAWYGNVFHQEPFYAYMVAVLYLVLPREPTSVILVQLVMGSLGCGLVYLAARRIVAEGAALTAGLLSCVYGPYLFYESLMLRDSIMIPLNAALLWVLIEARARSGGQAAIWWACGGGLAGVLYVTKANTAFFFVLFVAWTVCERRLGLRRKVVAASLMLACFFVVLLPVSMRNMMVGAPALKITTRGPIAFINGNNPWYDGIGFFDGNDPRVGEYARRTMDRANGRLVGSIVSVLRDWSSNPWGLLRLQVVKTGYLLAPYEMPSNASYSFFRENSQFLRYGTLSFYWISPLALAGLVLSWPCRRDFAPVLLFLFSSATITVAFYVVGRFRAPLLPAVMILAGLGGWSIITRMMAGKRMQAALLTVLVVAGFTLNTAASYEDWEMVRPQDYLIAIDAHLAREEFAKALIQAERGRRVFPSFPQLHRAAGMIYLRQGRRDEALAALKEAISRDPSDVEARREVLKLEQSMP